MQVNTPNTKPTGNAFLGHIAAIVTVTMWGYSFVSSKVLLENGMGPVQIYVCRFLLAYLVVIFMSHKRLWASTWREDACQILKLTKRALCLCGKSTEI